MTDNEEVIDLTDSFILANHRSLNNEIIVIDTEESFDEGNVCTKEKKTTESPVRSSDEPKLEEKKSSKFGQCPICMEELGKSPMASTRCGHVYCISCLKESLLVEKKCPTCRTSLKGPMSFHPLYLGS